MAYSSAADTKDAASAMSASDRPLKVAVIGAGPAGFYLADALLRAERIRVHVDIFDRLPTPYGLVRGGVAPDHETIKSVARVFEKTAARPGFRFFGNVNYGRDLTLADLRQHYDQIAFSVGNEESRSLGIPGEDFEGCLGADRVVGWYNGHPDYFSETIDLATTEKVVVVGNGNVAIDIARILARPVNDLRATDISDRALKILERSAIKDIYILGRRGPEDASFSAAEVRELGRIDNVFITVDPPISGPSINSAERTLAELRKFGENRADDLPPGYRHIAFRFLVSPVQIIVDPRSRSPAARLRLEHNRLIFDEERGVRRPVPTRRYDEIEVDKVIVAIGYRGRGLPDLPYNNSRGVIENKDGRVTDPGTGRPLNGVYVAGWAKSGPKGLIGSHKGASAKVAALMIDDALADTHRASEILKGDIAHFLLSRNIQYITFGKWKRIDAAEISAGVARGASRSKFTTIEELVRAAQTTT